MKIIYLLILSTVLFFSISASADQLIIEPEMGRIPLINAIKSNKHSLNLVMYGFTDKKIRDSIINEKKNGHSVQVIIEKTPYKAPYENIPTINEFKKNDISWKGKVPPYALIHQKTLLIDDKFAIIMTFNFTFSAYGASRNFALILDNPRDIQEIKDHFFADWNQLPISGSSPNLIWSTEYSREKIIRLIRHAQKNLYIYTEDIQDKKIAEEIIYAAKKGIKVKILTSKKPDDYLENIFSHTCVQIRYDKKHFIHAKVIIIDHEKALIGSINFTAASFDKNRELSAITQDKIVLSQLISIFKSDWRESSPKF